MLLELSDALAAMTVMALLGTVIITGPLSLLLLLLYRRAVRRGMRRRATDVPTVASAAGTDSLSPPSPATLLLETDARPTHRGGELYAEARRRQARTAARHALAGAVHGAAWFAGALWLLPDEMTTAGVAALLIASLFPGLFAWTAVKEPGRFAWLFWAAYSGAALAAGDYQGDGVADLFIGVPALSLALHDVGGVEIRPGVAGVGLGSGPSYLLLHQGTSQPGQTWAARGAQLGVHHGTRRRPLHLQGRAHGARAGPLALQFGRLAAPVRPSARAASPPGVSGRGKRSSDSPPVLGMTGALRSGQPDPATRYRWPSRPPRPLEPWP